MLRRSAVYGVDYVARLRDGVAEHLPEQHFVTLDVPDTLAPSMDRSWLVNPLEAPTWVWVASAIPAMGVPVS